MSDNYYKCDACGESITTTLNEKSVAFVELAKWLVQNKRSVFLEADISAEHKKKIANHLGYSKDILE